MLLLYHNYIALNENAIFACMNPFNFAYQNPLSEPLSLSLSTVQRTVVALELTWEYQFCQNRIPDKGHLQKHITTVHLKEALWVWICQKIFSEKSSLQKHITAVHLKEKPHECDICQNRFSEKGHLQKHLHIKVAVYILGGTLMWREIHTTGHHKKYVTTTHVSTTSQAVMCVWRLLFCENLSWQKSHSWGFSLRSNDVMCVWRLPFFKNLPWKNSHS